MQLLPGAWQTLHNGVLEREERVKTLQTSCKKRNNFLLIFFKDCFIGLYQLVQYSI